MSGFQDIIGHEQIIEHLKNAVILDKVSHAYIFNGPEHAGKRMLAEAFAMTLQCANVKKGMPFSEAEPCMECRSCRQAMHRNQPDILYVTHEKTQISVDDIRTQVNQDIDIRPYSSRYKVYIIDEAEKMNVPAQNALLKTIEEPPSYAVILLLTTNADGFLPTIRSRCVTLNLKPVGNRKIRAHLMEHCRVPDYQADLCVSFAQGNVGWAMLLASSEKFNELKDYTMQLMRRLRDIPVYDLMQELKPLNDFKDNIRDFLDLLLFLLRDVLLYKSSKEENLLIFSDQTYAIRQMEERTSYDGLNKMIEAVHTADRRIRANVNFELTLELLLLEIKENLI